MIFGRKNRKGATILILDVENSSVGTALVRTSAQERPRLFGEMRVPTRFFHTISPTRLYNEATAAVNKALAHIMQVAARMRIHAPPAFGEISRVEVFISAPWSTLELEGPSLPHPITQRIYNSVVAAVGPSVPVALHPFSMAPLYILPSLFPHEERLLISHVSGEITEVATLGHSTYGSRVLGHATLPFGSNSIVRTLAAHGGLSGAEALSALRINNRGAQTPVHESLRAIAIHLAEEFEHISEPLSQAGGLRSAFVIAHEPVGEWVARALADHAHLSVLFPDGGAIRALGGNHLTPYFASHARRPDITLLLEALFVDARNEAAYSR